MPASRESSNAAPACSHGGLGKTWLGVALVCLAAAGWIPQARAQAEHHPDPAAGRKVLHRVMEKYASFRTIEARFTQTYQSRVLRRERVEMGSLVVKAPGLMRWDYEDPRGKLFILNAEGALLVLPDERQAWTGLPAKDDDTGSRIIPRFLTGTLDVETLRMEIVELAPALGGDRVLKIIPSGEEEFESVVLELRSEDLLLKSATIYDLLGNRTSYSFSDYHFDQPVDDERFISKIPKGYEIIENGL